MSDLGSVVEREMDRVSYEPFTFQAFLVERERRQARQRLAAGLVTVGILALLVLVGLGVARSHDGSEPTPGETPVHGVGPLTFATRLGVFMQSPDGHGVRPADGQLVRLTGASVTAFAWSPDGSKLAYLVGGGGSDCVLWVEEVASQEATRLADCRSDRGHDLAWSPDGSRVLYVGEHALTTIGVDGSSPRTVGTLPRTGVSDLSWSPDATRISFASHGYLYVTSLDPWHPVLVAKGFGFAWSPDWSRLAYLRDDATGKPVRGDPFVLQVFSSRPDGSHPQLVTEQPGCCVAARPGLAWSPDGRMIALTGVRIQIVDVTTGHERIIRDRDLISGVPPTWRPVPGN